MTLPVDQIVDVSVSISAGLARGREFTALLVTNNGDVLSGMGADKSRTYDNASDLEAAYPQTIRDAANAYFAQDNYPNSLTVGRWVETTVNGVLRGAAPAAASVLDDPSDGSFRFANTNFDSIDFRSQDTYAKVATTLQTTIRSAGGALAQVSVTYDATAGRFEISFPPNVAGTYFSTSTGTVGTDVSANLGLTEAQDPNGENLILGAPEETFDAAMSAINSGAYCVVMHDWANDVAANTSAIQWAGANKAICLTDVSGENALVADETTSTTAQLAALRSNASIVTWSNTLDYKSMSVAGQICSRNLDAPRSSYTLKFKQLSGRTPDNLNTAQYNELKRKQVNAYANYAGGRSFYGEGYVTGAYQWIDIPVYATWFSEKMQEDILAYISGAGTKIPQTNEGVNGLLGEMNAVCYAAINNGGVAPGEVSARQRAEIRTTTGDDEFDGHLNAGFLNYISPLALQTQADREGREAPPAYCWLKLSGAMHRAVIGVRVEQ